MSTFIREVPILRAYTFGVMRTRKIFARFVGVLYLLLGVVNLFGLFVPEIQEQIISLGAVVFRYCGFVIAGAGLLMLRKWSAYFLAVLLVTNSILVFTIYGGQTLELNGFLSLLPWFGPIFIVAFFYYVWPVLKPEELYRTGALRGDKSSSTVGLK